MKTPQSFDTRDNGDGDRDEIAKAINWFMRPGIVLELRALRSRQGTVSGYFDFEHRAAMVDAAEQLSGNCEAVYILLNPANPELLARAANRAKPYAKDTTADKDIVRRQFLLIDFDPKRPSGISATDAEHRAALDRARQCRQWLRDLGWPDPLFNDSGNGAHLIYCIDLPNDKAANALVKAVLNALAAKWDDEAVTVDKSVHNAARIVKLPGTLAAKGDHTLDRPHRIARIIEVPDRKECVTREQLESIGGEVPAPGEQVNTDNGMALAGFDIDTWIRNNNIAVKAEKSWNGGWLIELERCVWRPDQSDGGPCIIQHADGGISASCKHSKCQGKGWPELRDVVEPGWRTAKIADSGQPLSAIVADDDPHRLARMFVGQKYRHPDARTLVFWHGEWFRWRDNKWQGVPAKEVRAELSMFVKAEYDRLSVEAQKAGHGKCQARKVRSNQLNDVLDALQCETLLSSAIRQPAWLGCDAPCPANEVLALRNGLIHLPSIESGLLPPTPRFFSSVALDFDFDINAPIAAAWLEFLRQLWPEDQQSIDTLQDWFGYFLTADTRQQKILLIVGPPRSGKGTIGRVIQRLIAADNVAGPTLDSLTRNFGLSPLLQKSVAIISDARLNSRTPAAIVERLLSISGEDALTVDRKFADPLTVKLNARLVIFSNELPELLDASGAFANRIILLRTTNSWLGKEDTGLIDRLLRELPGILLWAIEGWQRLNRVGRFVQPVAGQELLCELKDLTSPVAAFVRECCVEGSEYAIVRSELYLAFAAWCRDRGQVTPMRESTFGRDLRSVIPGIKDRQQTINGKRVRQYVGIELAP